eukprot:TRINITY_DN1038_c0_g1_i3.p1 TRINITY_DN1038_c0_g1~~TRINITY_DN1038_c0_g1_i3.p1  ORF type:complete len:558 (-),score=158.39 TRINITY_DN1038_c0_g1_i3:157-1779(-)
MAKKHPERTTQSNYTAWRKSLLIEKANRNKLFFSSDADRRMGFAYQHQRKRVLEYKKQHPIIKIKEPEPEPIKPAAQPAQKSPSLSPKNPITPPPVLHAPEEEPRRTSITLSRTSSRDTSTPPVTPPITPREEATPTPPAPREVTLITHATTAHETYEFAGMHHIFDEHTSAITKLRFANRDNDLIAFSSRDGKVSICQGLNNPRLLRALEGHNEDVTNFEWSKRNDVILTSSLDCTAKLWQVRNAECLLTVGEKDKEQLLCCRFHPANSDIFLTGSAKGTIRVYESKNGRCVRKWTLGSPIHRKTSMMEKLGGGMTRWMATPVKPLTDLTASYVGVQSIAATSMAFDDTGSALFIGDNKGFVHIYQFVDVDDIESGDRVAVSPGGKSITSLVFKSWDDQTTETFKLAPSLLTSSKDNALRLFQVEGLSIDSRDRKFRIQLEKVFKLKCTTEEIRSNFCPLLSYRGGICLLSGSEDTNIHIFDEKKEDPEINRLQGHSSVVLDVCWNDDETLLASGDKYVIFQLEFHLQVEFKLNGFREL